MRLPIQVSIFVVRLDGEYGWECLLLHRVLPQMSFWQPVTGGVEEGETVEQTAARELAEETGFASDGLEPIGHVYSFPPNGMFKNMYEVVPDQITVHVFVAAVLSDESPVIDPVEHDDYRWCSYDEAMELLHWWDDKAAIEKVAEFLK